MRKIDEGMKQIKVNNGNLSIASIGKLLADTSIGNIIKGLADGMTKFDIGNKGAKATLNAYIRMHYVTKEIGFRSPFDPKGRKGKGHIHYRLLRKKIWF